MVSTPAVSISVMWTPLVRGITVKKCGGKIEKKILKKKGAKGKLETRWERGVQKESEVATRPEIGAVNFSSEMWCVKPTAVIDGPFGLVALLPPKSTNGKRNESRR